MTEEEKEEELLREEKASAKEEELITVDLKELYKFQPKDIIPDISMVRYSNLAYIQITHRDSDIHVFCSCPKTC
jgi:hypothetical protein